MLVLQRFQRLFIFLICCCPFVWQTHSHAQLLCHTVPRLSQGTNFYIYRSQTDQVFISSMDGLNIFDGRHTKVYKPSTHNLIGENIQSNFFEDSLGLVWFTTYQAIHAYDPAKDDFKPYFIVPSPGDTIQHDYKIVRLSRNELFVLAGGRLFVFDIRQKTVIRSYQIPLLNTTLHALQSHGDRTTLFACTLDMAQLYVLDTMGGFELVLQTPLQGISILPEKRGIWIGDKDGDLHYLDLHEFQITHTSHVVEGSTTGIVRLNPSTLAVSDYSHLLYYFNEQTHQVEKVVDVQSIDVFQYQIKGLANLYVDRDSILWLGSWGNGVLFHSFKKVKFEHKLRGFNITKIFNYSDQELVVLCRRSGIIRMRTDGTILRQWPVLPNKKVTFTALDGEWIDAQTLLFVAGNALYTLSMQDDIIRPVHPTGLPPDIYYAQLSRLSNGRLIVSTMGSVLYEIEAVGQEIFMKPYFSWKDASIVALYFKEDHNGYLYVSNNEKNIQVLSPDFVTKSHKYSRTLSIRGGIRDVKGVPETQQIYIANSEGLFVYHTDDHHTNRVMDTRKLLAQNIYTILIDNQHTLWLGTNGGLMQYHPETNEAIVFSKSDGIQDLEYNTHACLLSPNGQQYFGGVNGFNVFHPDSIIFSTTEAPVYIRNVLINDAIDSNYICGQAFESYDLSYNQNTLTFQFHSIDFADPENTRVQYMLENMDPDFVEAPGGDGIVRYANLPAGEYALLLRGSNADGHWNETIRRIPILIRPPFWQRWWFITLVAGAGLLLIYTGVQSYYKRKLREKNLIIEKQKAVEQERVRIAAEMHDDLGAGLTTIRYLSDKALKQARHPEEAAQIQRIADQSNSLVRNMSEIIWAMNSRFDTIDSLIAYIRRYAVEFLEEHEMPVSFTLEDPNGATITCTGEKRRNIFLVVKELLHNSVKYSQASEVVIKIQVNESFNLSIIEKNAVGFDHSESMNLGNGLYNCSRRIASIGGSLVFEKVAENMHITLSVPISLHHDKN